MIFNETQLQSQCSLWFKVRKGRISGSVCGKIINRNGNISLPSIIKAITRKSTVTTAANAMGKEQEPRYWLDTCTTNVRMVT